MPSPLFGGETGDRREAGPCRGNGTPELTVRYQCSTGAIASSASTGPVTRELLVLDTQMKFRASAPQLRAESRVARKLAEKIRSG